MISGIQCEVEDAVCDMPLEAVAKSRPGGGGSSALAVAPRLRRSS